MDFEDYYEEDNFFEAEGHLFDEQEDNNDKEEIGSKEQILDDKNQILDSIWQKVEKESGKKSKSNARKVRPKMTESELISEKGIPALKVLLDNYQFPQEANCYEKMNCLMDKIEFWAHHLFPQMNFDDYLEKVEKLGHKRPVKYIMKRLRLGMSSDEAMEGNKENDVEKNPEEENYIDDSGRHGQQEMNKNSIEVFDDREEYQNDNDDLDEFLSSLREDQNERISATENHEEDSDITSEITTHKKRKIVIDDDDE